MHGDSSIPMSQALCDGLPHVVDGVRPVCRPKQKSSEPLSPNGRQICRACRCGYTNFEFVSASDRQLGAFFWRKSSYHAGRDQQPAVRLDRDK